MNVSSMDNPILHITQLGVFIGDVRVGTIAETPDGLCAFEYDAGWLADGYSISPYSLPLAKGVFVPERRPFDGLFGVFYDSLPDGWGALVLDRALKRKGIDPADVSPLTRLSIMGSSGRGALRYRPETQVELAVQVPPAQKLDELAEACRRLFDDNDDRDLDEIYAAGGSSAGARPKAYYRADGAEWLVKFPSHIDPPNIGQTEYRYSLTARECGIAVPETRLFPSSRCSGYFGSKRFDREEDGSGVHMVTASGLLEVSHRIPALDYQHLFQVTRDLTNDESQLWQLFRLMCFNVFAHNQDDHSNNFSWLCCGGAWSLSPAYDLTFSSSFANEHATTVNGNGKPGMGDVLALAERVGLERGAAESVAREIHQRCLELLSQLRLVGEEPIRHAQER